MLRIGFVPLIDAAPLIVAAQQGFFADEGLTVLLERQIGWGNVRDKLTFGQLHASHALLGMPLCSVLGRDGFAEPLVAVMNLGCGADAITFGPSLVRAGVESAAQLAELCRRNGHRAKPTLAHVFGCSVHHYLLRAWLAASGINPDSDVRLCVLPPLQVAEHTRQEYLDGFCCGEPWNTLASGAGVGRIVAVTTDLVPHHPDKVLAMKCSWAESHPDTVHRLVRAVLRGLLFLTETSDQGRLARMLAAPEALNLPVEGIEQSLSLLGSFARPGIARGRRSSFDPAWAFPSITHHAWLGVQMIRWGHLPEQTGLAQLARRCVQSDAFRTAAGELGIDLPETDDPPMPLRDRIFTLPAASPAAWPAYSTAG